MMKAVVVAILLVSANAFAWGPTGHRVVGEVANKHLETIAASKIHQILGGQSLSRVSTWPDEIKSEPENYSHTFLWHYTDWRDEDHQHDEANSSGKLLTAIHEQIAILKDIGATNDKKVFAIKFLVHLIGDLHQPLHVGNGLDWGGNKCKVLFHKKEINLHQLWDEGMIEHTNLSFTELANYVSQGRTFTEIQSWKSGSILDWALESKIIRGTIYPDDVHSSLAPMSIRQYCRDDIMVPQEEMPKLGFEYSYKFIPVVEKRLFQAGLRLARILNEALR